MHPPTRAKRLLDFLYAARSEGFERCAGEIVNRSEHLIAAGWRFFGIEALALACAVQDSLIRVTMRAGGRARTRLCTRLLRGTLLNFW